MFRKQEQSDLFPATLARLEGFCHIEATALDDLRELLNFEAVPEMHDRLIVILARRLNAPVITGARKIREATVVTCVW